MNKKISILVTAIFVVIVLSGIKYWDINKYNTDTAKGKVLYESNCIACHGNKGLGDGVASKALPLQPDSIYDELVNPFGFKTELALSVLEGDNGQAEDGIPPVMPRFDTILTEEDVYHIFAYIKEVNES